MTNPQELDVLIIGAGVSAIAFAKFYLDVHPECRLLMVDRDESPGGSWNTRRLYPHFWSQTGLGMSEFSDLPMAVHEDEALKNGMIRGRCVTQYLESYLGVHEYRGTTLRDRFRSGIEVKALDKKDGLWYVDATGLDGTEYQYVATKVVVATGRTSIPHIPDLPNAIQFKGPIVHQENFGSEGVCFNNDVESVAVIGAGKAAADMVYASAKCGKKVHWIIREEGSGPPSLLSSEGRGSYRNSSEIESSRLVSSASPSPFAPDNRRTKLMGRTVLGRSLMVSVWSNMDHKAHALFDEKINPMMGRDDLQRLKPKSSVFWTKSRPAVIPQPDFLEVLAESTTIHRASITSMSESSLKLSNNTTIDCDALLLGTGWSESHFVPFTEEQRAELGLPFDITKQSPSESAMWSFQHEDADIRLRKKWPSLMNPPPYVRKEMKTTPYRLYKLMAPLNDPDRSVVFLGLASVANAFRTAESQAIWATGYFDQRVVLPSLEFQRREIAQWNVWCRRRYLNNGVLGNCLYYDWLGYCDAILEEARLLEFMRGSRSLWDWWTRPNRACDLYAAKKAYLEHFEGLSRVSSLSGKESWSDSSDAATEVNTINTIQSKRSWSISSWRSREL